MGNLTPVLITERFDDDTYRWLSQEKTLEVSKSQNYAQPHANELAQVQALIIRSQTPITRELLAQAPQLKLIVSATSGFDHIDLNATSEKKITVMHTPEANASSAAELTWALLLQLCRRLNLAQQQVQNAQWAREQLRGSELQGKTYGILGLGRVGQKVATIAHAFGMQVTAYDPYQSAASFEKCNTQKSDFLTLLKESDVISCHVPLTQKTQHLITEKELQQMKKTALLINTSRGSVICEKSLASALEQKTIAGAGLDVFETEPLAKNSPLLSFEEVALSPHIGATTTEAFSQASKIAAQKVVSFFKEGAVKDALPPKEAWFFEDGALKDPRQ